ncbi:AraC family transcriptional regulator [Streptomyces sp. NPDC101062]|uniref:AraC family transcriptional regulator n=1 Tax=unclassified Streptomyces TaxID=2593676 RepID=UPI003813C82E
MDPIDDLLTTMKIENSRYVRVEAHAPWGISFPPRHLARLVLISRGSCWLTAGPLDRPLRLKTNDCFLVRAGVDFTLQDETGSDVVDCDGVFAQASGNSARAGGDGELTEIISSRFAFDAVASEALFALLPPLFRLSLDDTAGQLLRATFDLIAQESAASGIGAGFVMSRLSDVLFVQALRACCAEAGGGTIGWLAALREPRLSVAMREMHADLAHPWTVDALARKAGMSRSAFAALFKEKAGDTPLAYLASWRMYRVKTLLRETPLSVQEIAVRVGYDTGTALSRAFLRREGVAPGAWRHCADKSALSGTRRSQAGDMSSG